MVIDVEGVKGSALNQFLGFDSTSCSLHTLRLPFFIYGFWGDKKKHRQFLKTKMQHFQHSTLMKNLSP